MLDVSFLDLCGTYVKDPSLVLNQNFTFPVSNTSCRRIFNPRVLHFINFHTFFRCRSVLPVSIAFYSGSLATLMDCDGKGKTPKHGAKKREKIRSGGGGEGLDDTSRIAVAKRPSSVAKKLATVIWQTGKIRNGDP